MGVVNYYARYVPKLAAMASPLHELLKKTTAWKWGSKEEEALDRLKESICRDQALVAFDSSRERKTYLTCDASETGMGAVLEQLQDDGERKPVMYWSSAFRAYERNYSIPEKEALACVAAINKFRIFLLGRHFTLRTDHRALNTLLSQQGTKRVAARTERWREKLSIYDYDVEVIRGQDNPIAYWLSRSENTIDHEDIPLKEEYVINSVRQRVGGSPHEYGPELRELVDAVKRNEWTEAEQKRWREFYVKRDELTILDDLLFRHGSKFVPDVRLQSRILREAHGSHMGRTRMGARIGEVFWWPGWTADVERFTEACPECLTSERAVKLLRPELHPVSLPHGPWQKVAIDIKGPTTIPGHRFLIVAVDYYSKWPEAIPVDSISSETIIGTLKGMFN